MPARRCGPDRPAELGGRGADHRHAARLRRGGRARPGGHDQDHPLRRARHRADRGGSHGPARRSGADSAPVPPPESRAGRQRAARPKGQHHRKDHRGDPGAGGAAHRQPARADPLRPYRAGDRCLAAPADRRWRRSAAGGRRFRGCRSARCRPRRHRCRGRRDPAFRHAGGPRQPDLPGADRRAASAGAARLRPQPGVERDRFRAVAAVRRPAGRAARPHAPGRRRLAEGNGHQAAAAREGASDAALRRRPAQRADDRRVGAGRRAVPADGAAQQAAGGRQDRQDHGRARGRQRAVQPRPAGAGGDRAYGRTGGDSTSRPTGALCPRARLRRRIIRQPESRHRRPAARQRRRGGVPGRHAAGDRADHRPAAGSL